MAPYTVYASPALMALVGSVGTAGKLALRPLKAGTGLYGSSVCPQPGAARKSGTAHTNRGGATRRAKGPKDGLPTIRCPPAPAPRHFPLTPGGRKRQHPASKN